MGPYEWTGIIVAVVTIVGSLVSAIRWVVKHYLYELVPNGGSSLKDKVNNLEKRVDEIYTLLVSRGQQ
jgi:hypothetical protein